jgi:hypothetical protein
MNFLLRPLVRSRPQSCVHRLVTRLVVIDHVVELEPLTQMFAILIGLELEVFLLKNLLVLVKKGVELPLERLRPLRLQLIDSFLLLLRGRGACAFFVAGSLRTVGRASFWGTPVADGVIDLVFHLNYS